MINLANFIPSKPLCYMLSIVSLKRNKVQNHKLLVGIDIFFYFEGVKVNELSKLLQDSAVVGTRLSFIANRDEKVWPLSKINIQLNTLLKCRFKPTETMEMKEEDINIIVKNLLNFYQLSIIKTEMLFIIDGKPTYTIGKG